MLALFHGARDIERVREEADCVLYHLPWLRPFDLAAHPGPSELIPAVSDSRRGQRLAADMMTWVPPTT